MDKMPLKLEFDFLLTYDGACDECGEPAHKDAQTVVMRVNDHGSLFLHQVCAWRRATFVFGEIF